MNCGIFNVSSRFFTDEPTSDCVMALVLTIGGTGVPLIFIICLLLCCLCCTVCRHRKRTKSVDITKLEEGARAPRYEQETVEVQLQEVNIPSTDDVLDNLYDSVDDLKCLQATKTVTVTEVKVEQGASSEARTENEPQPYEEIVLNELPMYAEPDKKRKLNGAAKVGGVKNETKRSSMPLLEQDYSSLGQDKTDPLSHRSFNPLPPESMYSSIGDIAAPPPLPPPLAPEDVPESDIEKSVNTPDRNGSIDFTGSDQNESSHTRTPASPLGQDAPHFTQSLKEPDSTTEKTGRIDETDQTSPFYTNVTLSSPLATEIEELLSFGQPPPANTNEKIGTIDDNDKKSPFYTNVTLTHKPVHRVANVKSETYIGSTNINGELSAESGGNKTFLEDEPEIIQDLYVNV